MAHATGPLFDEVALVADGDHAWVAWSDRSGTYVRPVDAHGAPSAERRRVGPACPGGVAATTHEGSLLVACLRPGDRDRDRDGHLAVYRVGESVDAIGTVTPVRDRANHPSVASRGARAVVGWRDADVFTARARVVELVDGALGEPRTLSSGEDTLASGPSVHFVEGRLVAAWTESWLDDGAPRGHLLVHREGEPPRPSLDVHDVDVHTFLTSDARGPMVAMRDRRPGARSHRSFVGRLDDALRLSLEDVQSPTRADSQYGRPMIVACGEHWFSVATRRSSREVTMVTVRRLDADLEAVEAEHQIYEYHARFGQAVGVCVQGRLLLAVGERESDVQPRPRLHTYELICGPGRPHARTPGPEGRALREGAR